MLGRLLRILSRPAVLVLLFCFSLTVFCWPMLRAAEGNSLAHAHFTLFAIWTVVVVMLWIITRAISATSDNNSDEETS